MQDNAPSLPRRPGCSLPTRTRPTALKKTSRSDRASLGAAAAEVVFYSALDNSLLPSISKTPIRLHPDRGQKLQPMMVEMFSQKLADATYGKISGMVFMLVYVSVSNVVEAAAAVTEDQKKPRDVHNNFSCICCWFYVNLLDKL